MKHMPLYSSAKPHTLLFAICLVTASVTACSTNPVSHQKEVVMMSESQELELGQKAAAQIASEMSLMSEDDPLVKYVSKVGQRVAAVSDRPELFYRFHVVDDTTINAFALPGGYIYMYRGLLNHMNSEAELAAVLGHEIGHVTARHAVQQYTKAQLYQIGAMAASIFVPGAGQMGQVSDLVANAVIAGYGRGAELQSDELSIKYIARAGYNVEATEQILKTLKRLDDLDSKIQEDTTGKRPETYHGAFASHPETKKRIEEVVHLSEEASKTGLGETGRNAMLAALETYPYGDSPSQGAMLGRLFIHPDLGIKMIFPEEWVVNNTPSALLARKRQQKAFFQLQPKDLQKRQSGEAFLRDLAGSRAEITELTTSKRDDFEVTQAEIDLSMKNVGSAHMLATVFMRGPKAYLLTGWSKRKEFQQFRNDFYAMAESFHSFSKEKEGDVPRIGLYQWKQGDSWRLLAERSENILGRFTADKLAALNGLGPEEFPEAGTIIKNVK